MTAKQSIFYRRVKTCGELILALQPITILLNSQGICLPNLRRYHQKMISAWRSNVGSHLPTGVTIVSMGHWVTETSLVWQNYKTLILLSFYGVESLILLSTDAAALRVFKSFKKQSKLRILLKSIIRYKRFHCILFIYFSNFIFPHFCRPHLHSWQGRQLVCLSALTTLV